jgi:hypothetical protein
MEHDIISGGAEMAQHFAFRVGWVVDQGEGRIRRARKDRLFEVL